VFESAKDMWNREVEDVVRRLQYTDWTEVRERIERGAERVWSKVREGVREVEEKGEKAKEPVFADTSVRGTRGREGS
jgi:hypothetical protein